MPDEVMELTKGFEAWTVSVKKGSAPAFLEECKALGASHHTELLVLKSEMIFGADQVRSALYHAKKAMREKRNASDSLPKETLLYCSGERQLSVALGKMAVDTDTEEVVVAKLDDEPLPPEKDWKALPGTRPDISLASLSKFGISHPELASLDRKSLSELVLEKVASVDVIKK